MKGDSILLKFSRRRIRGQKASTLNSLDAERAHAVGEAVLVNKIERNSLVGQFRSAFSLLLSNLISVSRVTAPKPGNIWPLRGENDSFPFSFLLSLFFFRCLVGDNRRVSTRVTVFTSRPRQAVERVAKLNFDDLNVHLPFYGISRRE